MAGSLNKVMLIGNLGRDPEVRRTQNGQAICNLNLATSESWFDKATNTRKENTEWHRVVIFGKGAEVAEKYAFKGMKMYVEGKMQTRKWTDKDGQERHTTEIVADQMTFLDKRESDEAPGKPSVPFDDEIPF